MANCNGNANGRRFFSSLEMMQKLGGKSETVFRFQHGLHAGREGLHGDYERSRESIHR
jgi:hypothetical protein